MTGAACMEALVEERLCCLLVVDSEHVCLKADYADVLGDDS